MTEVTSLSTARERRRFADAFTEVKSRLGDSWVTDLNQTTLHGGMVHVPLGIFEKLAFKDLTRQPTDGRPSVPSTPLTTADKEALVKTQYCSRHFEGARGVPQTCPTCVREDIIKRLGEYSDPGKSTTLHLADDPDPTHPRPYCGATLTKWVTPLPTTRRERTNCPDCLIMEYTRTYVEAPEDPQPPLVTSPYMEPVKLSGKFTRHEGPHHEHDCEACTYLGSETDAQGRWNDLYYCFAGGQVNLIARYGAMGDYISGMDFIHRDGMLALAFVLALRAGKIRTSDIG